MPSIISTNKLRTKTHRISENDKIIEMSFINTTRPLCQPHFSTLLQSFWEYFRLQVQKDPMKSSCALRVFFIFGNCRSGSALEIPWSASSLAQIVAWMEQIFQKELEYGGDEQRATQSAESAIVVNICLDEKGWWNDAQIGTGIRDQDKREIYGA